jgi:hypothetical protein
MAELREPKLISGDDVSDVAGTVFEVSRKFGQELGNLVNLSFLGQSNADWFKDLRALRKNQGKTVYDDPLDIRFLLKEAGEVGSPVQGAIPGYSSDWKEEGHALRKKLNSWNHGSLEPDLNTLEEIITLMSTLAHYSSLPILGNCASQLQRITDLRNGWRPSAPVPPEPQAPEVAKFVSEAAEKKKRIFARPPVGAVWNGPIGDRSIELNKSLRDALDNGISVAHEIKGGKEKVREWLRYFPQGGEVRVASDGAVMGYVKGVPILIGYFGDEPDVNPDDIRGYYLPHDYQFTGDDVMDVQTKSHLSDFGLDEFQMLIGALDSKIEPGTVFNVTTYGDVVLESDTSEDAIKLARVHKDLWFPGQLA